MVTDESRLLAKRLTEAMQSRSVLGIDEIMVAVRSYQRIHGRDMNLGDIASSALTMRDALTLTDHASSDYTPETAR
ncbi:hypothetical protein BH11ARM2_BH11ARM2_25590 [soil metagenome]